MWRPPAPGSQSIRAEVLEPSPIGSANSSATSRAISPSKDAGPMYISLNTVKTHAKAVYRKLGATCRSEAVKVARAHGLL